MSHIAAVSETASALHNDIEQSKIASHEAPSLAVQPRRKCDRPRSPLSMAVTRHDKYES